MTKTKTSLIAAAGLLCAASAPSLAAPQASHQYEIALVRLSGKGPSPKVTSARTNVAETLRRLGGKVVQQIRIQSADGKAVNVRSGEDIPYVSSIGTTADAGLVPTTSTVTVGTSVDLYPADASGRFLVKVDTNRLVRFVRLDAGGQLGSLTQPETRRETLTKRLRDALGVTYVVPAGHGTDGAMTVMVVARTI